MTNPQSEEGRQQAAKDHLWMHFTRHSTYDTHQVPTIVLKNDCSGPTATWLRKPFLAQVCRRPRDRKLGTFDRCSQCRGSGSLIAVHDG